MSNGSEAAEIAVLICDDNATIRAYLAAVLETEPAFRVVGEAADGYEVVAAAKRLQPQVIILDLAMPNRTGLEALPELREVAPSATIIVLSAYAVPEIIEEATRLGAARYVEKGSSVAGLLHAIRSSVGIELPPPREATAV
jgi:two-component system nitrate/nitrite response regulator NarL